MERKGDSYRLIRPLVTGESSQREPVETELESKDTPTPPIPETTTPPDFVAKMRGMESKIQAMHHEQHEMRGHLFQLIEEHQKLAEDFH